MDARVDFQVLLHGECLATFRHLAHEGIGTVVYVHVGNQAIVAIEFLPTVSHGTPEILWLFLDKILNNILLFLGESRHVSLRVSALPGILFRFKISLQRSHNRQAGRLNILC